MAAQSEAASVKGSPFSRRRPCAVLYSTSGRLASWSFLLSAQFRRSTPCNWARSLRNRGARGSAGEYSINQLPILDDEDAAHEYELDPLGVLQRFFIGGFVDDPIRVEHGDVRVRSRANPSFVLEHRRAFFQPLRRHQRHLLQRGHQVQRLLFPHVAAQYQRVSARGSRVPLAIRKMAVAGDHRQRSYDGGMNASEDRKSTRLNSSHEW